MTSLPQPIFEKTLDNFFYDKQFKKYLYQFMAIFTDMQVQIGKNDYNSGSDKIYVPIKHGSVDRVVQAIFSDNTQNKLIRLPMMSAKIVDIAMSPDKYKGLQTTHRKVQLPLGESLPDGLEVVRRRMPMPYEATFELAIYTSNADQLFQILEQILTVFDPSIQIQTSDKSFDWTKINTVTLDGINMDENYPAAQDRRIIIVTLNFSTIVYIAAPTNYKKDFIKSVQIRLDTLHTYDNTQEIVKDVNRPTPNYEKLYDIDDYDIPKS